MCAPELLDCLHARFAIVRIRENYLCPFKIDQQAYIKDTGVDVR